MSEERIGTEEELREDGVVLTPEEAEQITGGATHNEQDCKRTN